jgi:choline kinase
LRVIIYAAGISRRLKKIAGNGLKGLLVMNGKRIIQYQLDWLVKLSVSEIIIVIGMEHELYREILGESYKGVPLIYIYNPDYKNKGNMLSLWHARKYCDNDTLFTTSDLICSKQDILKFTNSKLENKILIDNKSSELFLDPDPVKVTINNGVIANIKKNVSDLSAVDGVAIGLYQFSKQGIKCIIESIDSKINQGNDNLSLYYAIDKVLKNYKVEPVYAEECKWIDIDTPDDLKKASTLEIN